MNTLIEFFSGKKTYLTTTALFVVLFGKWQGWWTVPEEVYVALLALALTFLRSGVNKSTAGDSAQKPPTTTLLLLCASVPLWFNGCAQIAPGNDPVVVNAERTAKIAFNTVDGFLEWEYANRAVVPQQVTKAADTLRNDFPPAYATLRNLTRAYKQNRTAENKANLTTTLRVVQTMLDEALKYLPPPQPKT